MRLSLVINTVALAPYAQAVLSSGDQPYSDRAWLLRTVILPQITLLPLYQIVVAGVFEHGVGYRYVFCDPPDHNAAGALAARETGWRAVDPDDDDAIIFCHDDHLVDRRFVETVRMYMASRRVWDILSSARATRARVGHGEPLNDGHVQGYINGHSCVMKGSALRKVNWASVPRVFTWDMEHTALCREAGLNIVYAPDLVVWDMEKNAEPWR